MGRHVFLAAHRPSYFNGAKCRESGKVLGMNHLDKADTIPVDRTLSEVDPDEDDGLVLPGGVANPDRLRIVPEAVRFVGAFFEASKPVAAICRAPWMLDGLSLAFLPHRTPPRSRASPGTAARATMAV